MVNPEFSPTQKRSFSARERTFLKPLVVTLNGSLRPRLELSEVGLLAKRLVTIDQSLRNRRDKKASFAMSSEIARSLQEERKRLLSRLEIPKKPKRRREVIEGLKRQLNSSGFPCWRINP